MTSRCFFTRLAQKAGLVGSRFPKTNEEADLAETALTKQLDKLSMEEHEKILLEIHGFQSADPIEEENDEDTSSSALSKLDTQLEKLKAELSYSIATKKDKEAYDLARSINESYVHDKSFLQMFLRSEMYNIKEAAELIVAHFQVKRQLFPQEHALARDIQQSDLSEEAFGILQKGLFQVLPTRDVADRIVIVENYMVDEEQGNTSTTCIAKQQARWYFQMKLARDMEAQRKGVVFVIYNYTNTEEKVDWNHLDQHVVARFPQYIEAVHYCYTDEALRPFVSGVPLFIPEQVRYRFRSHYGTPTEIDFQLQTFGIPTQDSPMQFDGSWKTDWHQEWLRMQQGQEEQKLRVQITSQSPRSEAGESRDQDCDPHPFTLPFSQSPTTHPLADEKKEQEEVSLILIPRRFDVLFGRGSNAKTHTGNLRAMHLCEMNREQYENATRPAKTDIAYRIISIIHESGGRFLKPEKDGGGWVEVDDMVVARNKISHFFRRLRSNDTDAAEDVDIHT